MIVAGHRRCVVAADGTSHAPKDVYEVRDGSYRCGTCGREVERVSVPRVRWLHVERRDKGGRDAALAAYKARSEALYSELANGPSDPFAPGYDEDEREQMETAHRLIGKAMEGEVFDDWITPDSPRPPYCYWCTMDGHTFFECPERNDRQEPREGPSADHL